ncbi:MAG TPA: PQQ-dependent sugar dehydrogenase [Hyphomonadaceae bacterium]|jgi:glucose/arabinose dehydrogenase/mono/diheme cytochrome c family protein|nr:PQQ-dependent sugar dehydrogenase [Hyphomonadaceae bacterium]
MMRRLIAASVLILAACSSTEPGAGPATAGAGQATPARAAALASAPEAAHGQSVYGAHCGACHNGGDETAPELKVLHTYSRDRVAAALSDGGVMSAQSKTLNAEERAHVIAFLTAPADVLKVLDAAAESADPAGLGRSPYRAEYAYPVRRVRDERDSPDGPRAPAWNAPKVEAGPFNFETWEQRKLRVDVVARGLNTPRAIEFLPTGEILISERAGPLRIVRDGKLDPNPIVGTPKAVSLGTGTGFMDIALHPDFKTNGLIYISYHKPRGDLGSNAIFRGRWDGKAIVDGKDIFLSDDVDALYSRLAFGPDGKLYATIGCPGVGTDDSIGRAQLPGDFAGKTLRLNDDGTVPSDNPFVGRRGYNPEIFTLGHRVMLGFTLNPWTKQFWASEMGPQGGDEVNVLKAGSNYGWPILSDGRYYAGPKVNEVPFKDGLTRPWISYVPAIAPGGMVFYTGDKFPGWKKNLFLGSMRMSNSPRTGHIERLVFNDNWELIRSEMLLTDLHQRIRDVEQSPDGYLYVITDEGTDSVLMKLSPG